MSIVRETNKYLALKEDEPPPKKLVTEGDILIKDLALRQRKTNVSIQDYLQHPKTFEKVSEHISLTSCHSGTTTLDQFKNVVNRIEDIEYLRSAGLANDDIQLLWDYHQNNTLTKYKKVEHSILEDKIKEILETLRTYNESQNTKAEGVKTKRSLSEEMLLAAKPNSTTTRLLKFAISNDRKSVASSVVSSMDKLKEIERDRFAYLDNEKLDGKKVQKRIRNINTRINNIGKGSDTNINEAYPRNQPSDHLFVADSKWDIRKADTEEKPSEKLSRVYTCKPKNYYTIKNNTIVKLNEEQIKEKGIEMSKRKLDVEEITKLPKFRNYDPGQPTNVLYLKNLPKNISEENLKGIFLDFPGVTFRIMGGKMKGQAFVTCTDTQQAHVALERINGLLINNKPIVMEYGKKRNS